MADSRKLLSNILSNYLDQPFAIRPHITPKNNREKDAGILADLFYAQWHTLNTTIRKIHEIVRKN